MPGGGGLDAVEALSGPGVAEPIPVIVFTTFHLDEYLYGAFERGAVGYLLKKNPAAIRAAVNASALQSPVVRSSGTSGTCSTRPGLAIWAYQHGLNP